MLDRVSGSGLNFTGLLTILFIVLKLMKIITWSWFWVLSPLWIPLALAFVFFIIIIIVAFITY